jgi:hypothetical protein
MPENEDLSIFGAVPSTTQYEEVQHDADKTVKKTNHADDVGKLSQSPSDRAKRCAWKARTSFRHAQAAGSGVRGSPRLPSDSVATDHFVDSGGVPPMS